MYYVNDEIVYSTSFRSSLRYVYFSSAITADKYGTSRTIEYTLSRCSMTRTTRVFIYYDANHDWEYISTSHSCRVIFVNQ
jgi:hypothetical protein